jgi:RNA-binding protein NOB1
MTDNSSRTTNANATTNNTNDDDDNVYQFLVVDSGPIIRLTGSSALWKRAKTFYTVPAALREIRDAKARHHLDQLPFDLIPKEPSAEGIRAIVQFAKQTGDYASLSAVDIQVLGLLYDLEREGCRGDVSHIRTKPKRMVGAGKVELLKGKKSESTTKEAGAAKKDAADQPPPASLVSSSSASDDDEDEEEEDSDDDCSSEEENDSAGDEEHAIAPSSVASSLKKPSCWAALFDQSASIPVVERAAVADAGLLTHQVSNVNINDDPFGDAEEDVLLDDLFQNHRL